MLSLRVQIISNGFYTQWSLFFSWLWPTIRVRDSIFTLQDQHPKDSGSIKIEKWERESMNFCISICVCVCVWKRERVCVGVQPNWVTPFSLFFHPFLSNSCYETRSKTFHKIRSKACHKMGKKTCMLCCALWTYKILLHPLTCTQW